MITGVSEGGAAADVPARGVLKTQGWFLPLTFLTILTGWYFIWYGETIAAMEIIWRENETFAHGYLVAPTSLWMVWRQRSMFASMAPRVSVLGLAAAATMILGWLLGALANVASVQQFCFIGAIIGMMWGLLGTRIAKAAAFPLGFLLLAVPTGEFLLPILMEHTADFTVWALRLTGIPVYREGLYFSIPSGRWSVVEACSGLRYLIASVALGVLYAYLTYRSAYRRLAFIGISVVVPIIANWVRAYMIVMIGHLSNMKLAVGVDHLIYGWLFFGLVMALLFWIGAWWREDIDEHGAEVREGPSGEPYRGAISPSFVTAVAVLAAFAAAGPVAARKLVDAGRATEVRLVPPVVPTGWAASPVPATAWAPFFLGTQSAYRASFRSGDRSIDIHVAYYVNQRDGAELISSLNTLVGSGNRRWSVVGETLVPVPGYPELRARETRIHGVDQKLLVWDWYWIDGKLTRSPYMAKVLQAWARLRGHPDASAAVVFSTPFSEDPGEARELLARASGVLAPLVLRGVGEALDPRK